ncbi:hypothetical protein AF72_05510 [Xylella taiwanensis]|uniref:Uncharacterized protein n=1 Tax=Xylella taiwanensis TaxID=1444770 RepID=Z9JL50_9GAMM|nr:hypothetical protein AF72_05510 [Xylella taiwanensis]
MCGTSDDGMMVRRWLLCYLLAVQGDLWRLLLNRLAFGHLSQSRQGDLYAGIA